MPVTQNKANYIEERSKDGWLEGSALKTFLRRAFDERSTTVTEWELTAQYLRGEQVVETLRSQRSPRQEAQSSYNNQTITNQMLPIYRTTMSLLRSQFPRLAVTGQAASTDNISKALASMQVLDSWWHINDIDYELWLLGAYLAVTGNGALHTFWDPGLNRVKTVYVKPYDLLGEPGARDWRESRFICVRQTVHVDEAIASYPEDEAWLRDKAKAIVDRDEESRRQTTSEFPLQQRLDMWDIYFRDGKHGILCENKWLWKGSFNKKTQPVTPIGWTRLPDTLWSMGQQYPLVDMQIQYNRHTNFALDFADANSNAPWLVARQAEINPQDLVNRPNQTVRYSTLGGAPSRLFPSPVPEHMFRIPALKLSEMMDVAGVHSTTMGKRASGMTSGKSIESLSSKDIDQLGSVMANIEHAIEESARTALVLWQEFVTEEQAVRLFDTTIGQTVFATLKGTDILEDPEVRIEAGSTFISKASERDDALLSLFRDQAIDAPTLLAQLSFKVDRKQSSMQMVDMRHAQDLLEAVKQGLEIEIFTNDNVAIIADVFGEYMKSPAYYEAAVNAKKQLDMTDDDADFVALAEAVRISDNIRDVYVSVTTPIDAPPEVYQQMLQQKVFPRSMPKPQEALPTAAAMNGSDGAQQFGEESLRTQDIGNRMSTAREDYETMRGMPGVEGSPG